MSWQDRALGELGEQPCCGYRLAGPPASEPTALAALALCAWGQWQPAQAAGSWLADLQSADGSVGVRAGEPSPGWPTSLAVLAWQALELAQGGRGTGRSFADPIARALRWILATKSEPLPPNDSTAHDTTLVAWPWVEGTHAWVEPTALCLLALKAAGLGHHPRACEATRLLLDRQLPGGGCNYGNTWVMGRFLTPHLQPTGLAVLALDGQDDPQGRITAALAYLSANLSDRTTTVTLAWSLLGLAAHRRSPQTAASLLEVAAQRGRQRDPSLLKTALLLLAAQGEQSPLVGLSRAHSSRDAYARA